MSRRRTGPPQQRRVFAALDQALASQTAPTTDPGPLFTSRASLEALAGYLDERLAEASTVAFMVPRETFERLSLLARAAATHGYPRPALEALGSEADRLPTARTVDPVTSHDARPPQATRRNHLGRLLVGFLMYERAQSREHPAWDDDGVDETLTSEELAARVGLLHAEYAKRCSDLKALGYIRVAQDSNGHDRTRRGAAGPQRLVFELTADGRRKAEELAKSAG